jgi:hypothetical protein
LVHLLQFNLFNSSWKKPWLVESKGYQITGGCNAI